MAQECLGNSWVLLFAATLLSLRHRDGNCQSIRHGFATMFTREELVSFDLGDMEFDAESERAPELKQCRDILDAFNAFAVSTSIADLADSIAGVTLSPRGKKQALAEGAVITRRFRRAKRYLHLRPG
ncbi:hypothetical protein VFPBJ_05131 [Purpureocillium lilacinum]|uniref:Uncharacterized protein n=1 Tax=Purpureocillium lilacinum TaxID=33203 RepID=A0A179GX45_PURLI|nr:hypothetical protein VFPBJ_05131 [Purpureocillium lilacinum]